MAVFLRGKEGFLSRLKSLTTLQRYNHSLSEGAVLQAEFSADSAGKIVVDMSKWRKINASLFGIKRSMIPSCPWTVLKILRGEGFEAYLVGGCVRDLILKTVPKDFDIITTAHLKQIKKLFHRAVIIGRRFPICKVHVKGSFVEVSSFETTAKHSEEKEKVLLSHMPSDCNEKDFIHWRNSMHRDFTINSLFFDPFKNRIYDYTNGMVDLRSLKLQTLIPAQLSFKEDCARILRGIRIAGRLGLSIAKDTETAIHKLSSSVKHLDKARIMMELNYMLSYGAAESTFHLLQRFKLLEIFLPFHAAYLDQQARKSAEGSIMLMKLLFSLDKLVTCDRPCDCILWVGLLAFHQALVLNPRDSFVILAFASVLYHGNWKDGVKFARANAKVEVSFVPEILGFSELKSDKELAEEVAELAYLVQDSVGAMIDADNLKELMLTYPVSLCSGLVFVPQKTGSNVTQLFDILVNDIESCRSGRESFMIDHFLLGKGDLQETRFVLGKVILETMGCGAVQREMENVKEPEVIEETNNATVSDLVKHNLMDNKDRKHNMSPLDPQQEVAKKQKVMKTNSLTQQEIAVKKQEMVLIDEQKVMSKMCQKVVKTECFSQQGITTKKQEVVLADERKVLAKKRQKGVKNNCLWQQEIATKQQEILLKDEQMEMAKKHQKVVKMKQVPDEQLNMMQKSMLEKKESHLQRIEMNDVLPEVVRDCKKRWVEGKHTGPSLSSLFK